MSDLDRLRAVLFVALGACGAPARSPEVVTPTPKPNGSDTAPPAAIDAAPPDAAPVLGGPVDEPMPSFPACPTESWCGKASEVKALATKAAADKLGCKWEVTDFDDVTGKRKPHVPKTWPMQGVTMTLDEAATQAKRDAKDQATCCYTYIEPCPGGRPLVVDGAARVAAVTAVDDDEAAFWAGEAAAEHASIASFARAITELMAVGAPASLLAETADALQDEVRHAALCFAQAARFAGRAVEPGPLPAALPRTADLAQLACDTFVEGCVGETIAVIVATRRRAACRDAEAARVLDTIIADETRHAALAWRTLRWAIETGGPRVRAAVEARAIPAETGVAREAWHAVILPALAAIA